MDTPEKGCYTALIGDVAGSKRISEKDKLSDVLWSVVRDETRSRFETAAITGFEITAWDEWEGVLATPHAVWDIIKFWEGRLDPSRITVGIGIGSLESPLDDDPRRVTGEAFYRARQALKMAKDRKSIAYVIGNSQPEELNLTFLLRTALRRRLTGRQRQVTALYEKHGDVRLVAAELGVTHQNVSQVLRYAEWDALCAAEQFIRQRLREVE